MGRERGSASILLISFLAVALTLSAAVAAIARVATCRARVSAAADLAALAAARAGDCTAGIRTGYDNGADAVQCSPDGVDMVVVASLDVALLPGRSATMTATARAGPPD